jgi:hypothetical protein
MVLVNEAWKILSNPELRQRYDEARAEPANLSVQRAAAAADAQQAHQQAEQYPRRWADLEIWLDGIAQDFSRAEFKPIGGRGSFLLHDMICRLAPTSGESRSGGFFILIGGVIGLLAFLSVFFGVLNLYTGLLPPSPYHSGVEDLFASPDSELEPGERFEARQRYFELRERYVSPYPFGILALVSFVGGAWLAAACHRGTACVINQSRRQSSQTSAEQKETH